MAESSLSVGNVNAFRNAAREYSIRRVILASTVGALIEYYDFFIFGPLAVIISPLFYPPGNETLALIAYLMTFAVGFVVRPFGALFFGRIGDLIGRKYAFLVTVVLMGGSTAAVGILPTFHAIGYAAPVLLILLRVLQGLAIGGEYGGAAVYVAEHVPDDRRGFYTSFIQITPTAGLCISLIVVFTVQNAIGREAFAAWGWRVPFLVSIVLVGVSLYIRLRMKESPIFQHLKGSKRTSSQPLREAFARRENLKRVLISFFGAIVGQAVVWYTAQLYALFYLQTILKVKLTTAYLIIAVAMLLGTPLLTAFGSLSDRIGRKKLMMAGCLLAVICYIPIYKAMVFAAGNDVVAVTSTRNPVTGEYRLAAATHAKDPITGRPVIDPETGQPKLEPAEEATNPNVGLLILLVFAQMIFVGMVYGPIAAYLVEAFPAKVRYTSLSLPYHIGNGVFGGLLPTIGLALCAYSGNIFAGLYYPMIVAGLTFVVGSLLLKETKDHRIWDELEEEAPSKSQ